MFLRGDKTLQKSVFSLLVLVATLVAGLLGFNLSDNTGVEPGFFEIAEAGGYGAGVESKAPEGLSEDLADYYSDLVE